MLFLVVVLRVWSVFCYTHAPFLLLIIHLYHYNFSDVLACITVTQETTTFGNVLCCDVLTVNVKVQVQVQDLFVTYTIIQRVLTSSEM